MEPALSFEFQELFLYVSYIRQSPEGSVLGPMESPRGSSVRTYRDIQQFLYLRFMFFRSDHRAVMRVEPTDHAVGRKLVAGDCGAETLAEQLML